MRKANWRGPSGSLMVKHKPCVCAWAFSGKSPCDLCSLEEQPLAHKDRIPGACRGRLQKLS